MMTGRYVLQFPRGIVISIFPNDTSQFKQSEFWENFRARIKKAFAEYTEETNPDYIVQDKLEFIDLIRELNFNVSAEQIINEAKTNAKKELDSLENEIALKKHELDDMQKQFDVYKAKMESLLISQLELIKDINKEDNPV